jgi:hypothetical protein
MRIRFTKDQQIAGRNYRAGTDADLPDDQARQAVDSGAAEELGRAERTNADGKAVMTLRFRRSATVAGKTYAAGSVDTVEINDDAWAAVNNGDADLDPPPGVRGQPFPPDSVTRSDAPVPPPPVVQFVQAPPVQPAKTTPPTTRSEPDRHHPTKLDREK